MSRKSQIHMSIPGTAPKADIVVPHEQTHITIVLMTKSEFLGKPKRLVIRYSLTRIATNSYLIASTSKGICLIMPGENKWAPIETLKRHFPHATFRCHKVHLHRRAINLLRQRYDKVPSLPLHLYGTPFQLSVWTDLLNIPFGKVTTYRDVALRIGKPRAARAVGRAVSCNPVMSIIPCHRVICANGSLGDYRWTLNRKIKMLNREARVAAKIDGYRNWNPMLI